MKEQVQEINVHDLHGFKNHPFQVKDDESLQALCDSIREYGILSPLLARPTDDGFEIVSGHRRKAAALRLGLDRLPVLVRDLLFGMSNNLNQLTMLAHIHGSVSAADIKKIEEFRSELWDVVDAVRDCKSLKEVDIQFGDDV